MDQTTTRALPPRVGAPAQHLAYLDGLRGIAILLVVTCHAAKYTMDFHQGWTYHALAEGAHGVDLFFVLSGFCLAYPILRQHVDEGVMRFDVLRFYCRRIVRIVPPYWVAFAAILIVSIVVVARGGEVPWPAVKLPPTFGDGFDQMFFLNSATNLCGSFWTLALEFRWYIVFPVILWLYVRWPWTIYALMAAALGVYNFTPWRVLDFATLPAFLLGIIAADIVVRKHSINRFSALLFVLAVVASLALEPKGHLSYARQNQFWWQAAAFFLVVAGSQTHLLRRLLSHRFIVGIGAAAYSIYLFHDPIEAWYAFTGGTNIVLAMTAGVLIGVLGWLLVERYVMERGTRDALVGALESSLKRLSRFGRATPKAPDPLPAPVSR